MCFVKYGEHCDVSLISSNNDMRVPGEKHDSLQLLTLKLFQIMKKLQKISLHHWLDAESVEVQTIRHVEKERRIFVFTRLIVIFLLFFVGLISLFLYILPQLSEEENRDDEKKNILKFHRTLRKTNKSSCLISENSFANAGLLHVSDTDDPNVVAILSLIQFLFHLALNSIRIRCSTQNEDRQELEINSKMIERKLVNQWTILQDSNQEDYANFQKEVNYSLALLNEYLELSDAQDSNKHVPTDEKFNWQLLCLLDELIVDRNDVNLQVSHTLLDAIDCMDERSETESKAFKTMAKILQEFGSRLLIGNNTCSKFRETTENVARRLLNRVQDDVLQIRLDEMNVAKEIRRILENKESVGTDKSILAKYLLEFLEENYKTRKWLVVVSDENQNTQFDQSRGFHTANFNGTFAAAISADRTNSPHFSNSTNALLETFRFPVETIKKKVSELYLRTKDQPQHIHQHFNRFLIPSWMDGRLGVESMAITTPCSTTDQKMNDYVTILASSDFQWKKITNKDDCANKQIIVVPSSSDEKPILKIIRNQQSSPLRNEIGRHYLSVKENSKTEGAYVTLDRHWRNATGQRWRFVNNQLVNDNGKCLTAWTSRSWYLFQYDCHSDWAGQIWIRHGLQIVNGFRFCLTVREEGSAECVVQDLCDSTPPFIWYNWECTSVLANDCDEAQFN